MISAAWRRRNMAIGVNCACVEGLVPHVHAVKTAVSPVVSLRTQCVGNCSNKQMA